MTTFEATMTSPPPPLIYPTSGLTSLMDRSGTMPDRQPPIPPMDYISANIAPVLAPLRKNQTGPYGQS